MGRFITDVGTASSIIREVNTAYTAVVNDRILADSSVSSFSITLPVNASLLVGDQIQIIDVTSSFNLNNVTLVRNGSLFSGVDEDLVLDIAGSVITLLYTGSTYGWAITSA